LLQECKLTLEGCIYAQIICVQVIQDAMHTCNFLSSVQPEKTMQRNSKCKITYSKAKFDFPV